MNFLRPPFRWKDTRQPVSRQADGWLAALCAAHSATVVLQATVDPKLVVTDMYG